MKQKPVKHAVDGLFTILEKTSTKRTGINSGEVIGELVLYKSTLAKV